MAEKTYGERNPRRLLADGLYAGTEEGTFAEGGDPRFRTLDIENQPAPEVLQGTEILPALQGGAFKQLLLNRVESPMSNIKSFNGDRYRGFTEFTGTPLGSYSETTDGAFFGHEDWVVSLSGTAARAEQAGPIELMPGIASLNTGTTTSGYCGLTACAFPLLFVPGVSFDVRFMAKMQAVSGAANKHNGYLGIMQNVTGTPAFGMYFFSDENDGYWHYVVENGVGASTASTGVAINTTDYVVFRVVYNATAQTTTFLINGNEVGLVDDRNMDTFAVLSVKALIQKLTNTTDRFMRLRAAAFDITIPGGPGVYAHMV